MKKGLKILGISLGVIILTLIIALICLIVFVNPNRLKPILSAQVLKYTGRELTISGDLSWTLFPNLAVKTGHMQLSNPPGFQQPFLAEIEEADINVKVLPLLHNKIESSGILLRGMTLNLVTNAKGDVNWRLSNPETQSKAPDSAATTASPVNALGLTIAGVDLSNANVNWVNEQTKQNLSINNFEFHSSQISFIHPFPVKMQFKFANSNPAASGEIHLQSDIAVNLTKQIFAFRSFDLSGHIEQPDKKLNIHFTGEAIANLLEQTLQCSDLKAQIENLNAQGKISITQLLTQPAITGQLQILPFDLREWLSKTGQDVSHIQAIKSVSGQMDLTSKQNNLSADGALNIDIVQVNNITLTQIHIPLHYAEHVLNIKNMNANFYKGSLQANADVNMSQATPQIATTGKFNNIQIGPLLDDVSTTKRKITFSGTANVDWQIKTAGTDGASITQNLNGTNHFSITNGTIEGIDLRYYIDLAKSFLSNKSSKATNTNRTEFAELKGSANINHGEVKNDDLVITSSLFTSKGKGIINLVNQQINYRLETFINKTGAMEDAGLVDISNIAIPISITGNMADPAIKLDTSHLTQSVADTVIKKTKDDLQNQIKKQLGDQGDALIQNLFHH